MCKGNTLAYSYPELFNHSGFLSIIELKFSSIYQANSFILWHNLFCYNSNSTWTSEQCCFNKLISGNHYSF